jgi:hypothetical protein
MRDGRGLKPTLERTVYGLMEHFLRRKPDSWPAVEDMVRDSVNYYRLIAGYACEERLDDLTKEAKFASSNAERQSINYKLSRTDDFDRISWSGEGGGRRLPLLNSSCRLWS